MKRKLLIVTKAFPYNLTEAFLESEIPYLKEQFESIMFLPLLKGKVRKNFVDAIIDNSYANLYEKKTCFCVRAFLSVEFYKALFVHGKKSFNTAFVKACFKQTVHKQILKKIIQEHPTIFDEKTIVYSYWFNAPVYAFLSLRDELNMHYKVVCRAHRWDVYDEQCEMPYRKYCIEKIDDVFPISLDACKFFERKYGHKEKYQLSRLGVAKRDVIARKSDDGQFKILTISQTTKRKRIDLILTIVEKFAKNNPSVKVEWTHFGIGNMQEELRKRSSGINLSNLRVRIMGYVPNTDIIDYLSKCAVDVFVNLSSSEGVPVSIMEAQSFGIPVIATNVGGTGEIVNEKNGILLKDSPTIIEAYDAMCKVYASSYNRMIIKDEWSKYSCAETNFRQFVKQLVNI